MPSPHRPMPPIPHVAIASGGSTTIHTHVATSVHIQLTRCFQPKHPHPGTPYLNLIDWSSASILGARVCTCGQHAMLQYQSYVASRSTMTQSVRCLEGCLQAASTYTMPTRSCCSGRTSQDTVSVSLRALGTPSVTGLFCSGTHDVAV